MDARYHKFAIGSIWDNNHKLELWQMVELAVISARAELGRIEKDVSRRIAKTLLEKPVDLVWWLARDGEIHHDFNAFVEERLRHLPPEWQALFHDQLTSYDTEEPVFGKMLLDSLQVVDARVGALIHALEEKARFYRYTIMIGRTHGQEAELQSVGKRFLTWLAALRIDIEVLADARKRLRFSKLSGAIGNYTGIDPVLEERALAILGFEPFYGATQIMPREIYAPVAAALAQLVSTFGKIGLDIRLAARSGRPLMQEPFGKKQTGSSAMPHKKNTIRTEQLGGMARMARHFAAMIAENIQTWEERAIEQSCVERVSWPDLFHVVVHSLETLTKVIEGIRVYPDNCLREIVDSAGCYASGEAKAFLRHKGVNAGLSSEDAYRIVQLAAWNALQPGALAEEVRNSPPSSPKAADELLETFRSITYLRPPSIRDLIETGKLRVSGELAATVEDVARWNASLKTLFAEETVRERWRELFGPSYLLRNEGLLYEKILGV